MTLKKHKKNMENLQYINSQNIELICKLTTEIKEVKEEMVSEVEKVNNLLISMQEKVVNQHKNDIEEFWKKLILMIFISIVPSFLMEFVFKYCELTGGLIIFLRILQFMLVFVVLILLKERFELSYPSSNKREFVSTPLYNFKETFTHNFESILSDISYSTTNTIKLKDLMIKNIQTLDKLKSKLQIDRDELSAEKERLLAFSKVISTAGLIDISIDLGIISTMLKLKDSGTSKELVINRFKLLEEHYSISLEVLIFIFCIFHDEKRSTSNNWDTIRNDAELLFELIEVFQDKQILPKVSYDYELQIEILKDFAIFNIIKAREQLLFGEKLVKEIEQTTLMLGNEGLILMKMLIYL
jgi:hypothetical protein